MKRCSGFAGKVRLAVIGACSAVALLPAAAPAGPAWSVTPVLVVPSDIPRGRVEGEKRLLLGEMTLARDWYAAALGRNTSINLQNIAVVYSPNPESYFVEPDTNTWFYRIVGDVNASGYTHGTTSSPQIIVGMVVGGSYHSAATQHLGSTGGGYANHNTGDYDASVIAHEIGHSFGLPHPDADNPTSGQRDNAYTVMYNWWDYPHYPANPADPGWSLRGLHGWQSNSGGSYQDQWLLANRVNWFSTTQGRSLNWDPDGAFPGSGGAGTWDASRTAWCGNASGPNIAWADGANTRAIFWGSSGGNVTIAQATTVQALTFYRSGYRLSGAPLTLAGGDGIVAVWNDESAEIASAIGGATGLSKVGGGTLVLSGSNNYSGPTLVGRGTLRLGANEVIPNGSAVTIASRAKLDLNGKTEVVGAMAVNEGAVIGAGNLVLGGDLAAAGDGSSIAGGTLTLNAARNVIVDGTLAVDSRVASGRLIKSGPGTLVLGNSANNHNDTVVTQGTLVSATPGVLGTGPVTLAGGTLSLGSRQALVAPPLVSGFGNNGTGWTRNGSASIASNLTTLASGYSQAGSVFYQSMVPLGSLGFEARFTYQNGGSPGGSADGITFILQRDPRGLAALGESGGSLAYAGAGAVQKSGGIAINLYPYASGGIGVASVDSGTVRMPYASVMPVGLDSGHYIDVALTYDGATLLGSFTDRTTGDTRTANWPMNLASLLGATSGYVGFTGATGGWTATHRVSGFQYALLSGWNTTYANAAIAEAGTRSTVAVPGGQSYTMGPLTLRNGSTLKLAPAAGSAANSAIGLTLGATSLQGNATLDVPNNGSGAGEMRLGALAGSGSLSKTGAGTLAVVASGGMNGDLSIAAGTFTVMSGARLVLNGDAVLSDPATLNLWGELALTGTPGATGPHVVDTRSVSLPGAGRLDLSSNALILRSGSAQQARTDYAWLAERIAGGQVFSSTQTAIMGLAFAINDRGNGTAILGSIGGRPARPTDVIALYALHGDSDFSGRIDGDDYWRIDTALLSGMPGGFVGGDFNSDGRVDGRDYHLIDQAYLSQPAIGAAAAVPEPAGGLALAAATLLLARRTARRRQATPG